MRLFSPAFITVAVVAACAAIAPAQTVTPDEAKAIAEDAYIYGYSLITTEVTRVQMSNVPAIEAMRAPMNTFFNVKRYPPDDYRGVSAPNSDGHVTLMDAVLRERPRLCHAFRYHQLLHTLHGLAMDG